MMRRRIKINPCSLCIIRVFFKVIFVKYLCTISIMTNFAANSQTGKYEKLYIKHFSSYFYRSRSADRMLLFSNYIIG